MATCDQCGSGRAFCGIHQLNNNNNNYTSGSRMSRHSPSRGVTWSAWRSGVMVLGLLLAGMVSPLQAGTGHTITAFEYQRKFHQPLGLGECPHRKVEVLTARNTTVIESQRCPLRKEGTVQHMVRELNDSRNVVINSPQGIVRYLGLCGGEAASFLGILVSGDCVAVEIASKLTFNRKTLIRAFVGLYRKSLDVLDSKGNVSAGMARYYKDKFYLKNRSYGTMDLIIVQFRFRNAKVREQAKRVELRDTSMVAYMRAIQTAVGKPRAVTVINLSTSTSSSYKPAKFKMDAWDRAVRHVQVAERDIWTLQQDITHNQLLPHLKYRLFPFVDSENGSLRNSRPLSWEKISMVEVQLTHAMATAKKTAKRCRGDKSNTCKRVRGLKRELMATQRRLHEERSHWVQLTKEVKAGLASKYSNQVDTLVSVTATLTKKARRERRLAKLQTLADKKDQQKSRNQIPKPMPKRPLLGRSRARPPSVRPHRMRVRPHRIRHARRKMGSRRFLIRG